MAESISSVTFLKPEHLAPIRNLNLRARMIVEGTVAGLHRSPYHGFSAEFLEYRPYRAGESTRLIDWRAFARSDRTFVKLFEDETNLFAHVLLDKSASMSFRSSTAMSKFDYARTLAAALAWILVRQRDAVGLALFDDAVGEYLPPRSTNVQLRNLIATLDRAEPSGRTACGGAINSVSGLIKKRGLTVVLSDLFDDPSSIIKGLRHLRFKRQEVIVLWIADPFERRFAVDAPVRISDLETGERFELGADVAAEYFGRGIDGHRAQIESACRELSVDLEHIVTNEPFNKALTRILGKRERLT
jgi:uncharacterized protein (DUF58 family)